MTDISRTQGKHKKRDVSVMAIPILASEVSAPDTYEAAMLPKNSLIIASTTSIIVPFDGTTPLLGVGFAGGSGIELVSGVSLSTAANTVNPGSGDILKTTGAVITLTKTGADDNTVGEALVTIEYIEYEQCTGELTNFVG